MTMPPGFLEDAVDLHVHSAPDVDVRRFDEVASELDRGARLACFAMDPRSLCLRWDRPQRNRGRLKPCRCEVGVKMGAKQVWMPTRSARNRVLDEHGHLSKEETFALIGRARAVGGVRVLVTHPEWVPTFYSVEHQRALAVHGNVMFQRCFVSTTHLCGFVPFETIERATDLGQPDTPPPVEGMRLNAERLCGSGFSVGDVRRMMQANPTRLLTRENT